MKRENSQILAQVIEQYIQELNLEDDLFRTRVFATWDIIVGAKLAELTSSKFYKDGVLYCSINSSVMRSQLLFRKDDIIAQLNKLLNVNCIKNVVLR